MPELATFAGSPSLDIVVGLKLSSGDLKTLFVCYHHQQVLLLAFPVHLKHLFPLTISFQKLTIVSVEVTFVFPEFAFLSHDQSTSSDQS